MSFSYETLNAAEHGGNLVDVILMESGDKLLLETGDNILIDSAGASTLWTFETQN